MNSPLRPLNTGAFHHLPYTFVVLNLLWCLSRGSSDLTFLSSSPPYEIQTFSYPSSWFPHWLGLEDHARPWFCPELVIINIFVLGFPIGLSPRTIQGLGSVQNFMPFFRHLVFPQVSHKFPSGRLPLATVIPWHGP